ncbi:MAG: hypothetical protein CMI09_08940 [Oceanospirillaceae bacterium]|nr:hypothetical protein [Oceanospirillaceae bacterium]
MSLNTLLNLGFGRHPLAHAIQWERHHLFMREVGGRMVASIVVAFIVGVLFIDSASKAELYIWFGGATFVAVNSILIIHYYTRHVGIQRPDYTQDSPEIQAERVKTAHRWHWINLYLSLIWGIFWSLPSLLFFADATAVQVYSLLMLMVLMSSMPSVTMGCYPDIYVVFLTPVLGVLSWQLLNMELDGGWVHKVVGPITWISLVAYSIAIFKTQIQAIILRLEHQQARQEAAEASQAKTRFIAAASHDLRQPLQAARLYMHALMQSHQSQSDADNALLERVNIGLLNANDLLDRLLDVSRLDAGVVPVNVDTFDLCQLGSELLDQLQGKADEKGLSLTLQNPQVPCIVTTDRLLMGRILRNLLENALHYTHKGEVQLQLSHRLGSRVQVRVCDTGSGIPEDAQLAVFEEFTRLPGSQSVKGVGMGLPIVQRLCQLLGVSLQLESRVGIGTEVTLEIPLEMPGGLPASEGSTVASSGKHDSKNAIEKPVSQPGFSSNGAFAFDEAGTNVAQPSLENKVVMAVDDNETILDAISLALIPEGCDVWIAESVGAALEQIAANKLRLDVLISDDQLGLGDTSDDLVSAVQATQSTSVPVLILTGNTEAGRIQTLQNSGYRVLPKPAAPERLIQALKQLLPTV